MSENRNPPAGMPEWLFDTCIKAAKGRPIFSWSGWGYWLFGVVRQRQGGWWLQIGPLGMRLRKPPADRP